MIRRFAFHYSESSYGHWLPLMLADRVNAVEGVLDDLASGHVPNVLAERGWNAEWRHNRGTLWGGSSSGGPRLRRRGDDRRDAVQVQSA
jgi:hypothetical protein